MHLTRLSRSSPLFIRHVLAFAYPSAGQKKSWRASLIRKRSRYLGFMSNRILGYIDAPDRASAEAAAVSAFSLTEEQRKRLVVQEQG